MVVDIVIDKLEFNCILGIIIKVDVGVSDGVLIIYCLIVEDLIVLWKYWCNFRVFMVKFVVDVV